MRVELDIDPAVAALGHRSCVFAFFHGTQWPLLAWTRPRPTVVMVSWSPDGALQAAALRVLGFEVVRGSSSRGGIRGLARVVRRLRRGGMDAAFAVDGPRGPYGAAKGGARFAAGATGAVLVPMGSAFARGTVLHRTWDRFGVAWPFTRVAVCLGPPIEPSAVSSDIDEELGTAILAANHRARVRIGAGAAGLTK